MSDWPVRFDDFVLQLESGSRGELRARVLKSPFGEGAARFSLPWLAGLQPAAGESGGTAGAYRGGAPLDVRPPLDVGSELFRSVFQGQVRTLLDKCRGQLEVSPHQRLRIKIKIDAGDDQAGALADLPWELLCDGETEDFFVLSRQLSLVRYLDVPRPSQSIAFTPPLRILAVGASPRGLPPLDLEEEMRLLAELDRGAPGVEVQFLAHASVRAVRQELAGDSYHVLHFMGHGLFDPVSGEGALAFERPDGSLDPVSGKAFATKVRDLRSLGVVVLNACNTARAVHEQGVNPYRGVATALVHGGVPAVVAMQLPISDHAAIGFSTTFYRHLARGESIDEALTEGRQAIHSATADTLEWATPVLFLRIPEGDVFVAQAAAPEPVRREAAPAAAPAVPPAAGRPERSRAAAVAAGVGGAALLAALWLDVLRPAPPAPSDDPTAVTPQTSPSVTPSPRPKGQEGQEVVAEDPIKQSSNRAGGRPAVVLDQQPAPENAGSALPRPTATPAPPPPAPAPETTEDTAAAADLSSLSAQLLSITRREGGGLRVTMSFRNDGDHPLSADLEADLSDEKGTIYSLLRSIPQLHLGPGASVQQSLDFPAPRFDSQSFHLGLMAADGAAVRVTGTPITLKGSP